MRKTATYTSTDGTKTEVEYDPDYPCIMCRQPVIEASVGGTVICPWCDMGIHRDGTKWTWREMHRFFANARKRMEGGDSARS